MENRKTKCLICFGKGRFEGVYGRTVCRDCDGRGKVTVEKRKQQLKDRREMYKALALSEINSQNTPT